MTEITPILTAIEQGDAQAANELLPVDRGELRHVTEPAGDGKALSLSALDQATLREGDAYIEGACAVGPELLERVNELLEAHEESRGPLDSPPPRYGTCSTFGQFTIEKPGKRSDCLAAGRAQGHFDDHQSRSERESGDRPIRGRVAGAGYGGI